MKHTTILTGSIFSFLLLSTLVSAQGFGLGQIGNNIVGSFSVLGYAVYILPVVVIVVLIYFWWSRTKNKGKGTNMALIYSIEHRYVADIKEFIVFRQQDEIGNTVFVKAIFPSELKKEGTASGILGFFKSLLSSKPKKDLSQENGYVFSESLALFNESTNSWLGVWSLESRLQLPYIVAMPDEEVKFDEMERSVEKRITSLKTLQLEDVAKLDPNAALSSFGKLQIICVILLFAAILFLAWGEFSISGTITTVTKVITAIHPIVNATKP